MRGGRRYGLVAVAALAFGIMVPSAAQGAKVKETAAGGVVPNATDPGGAATPTTLGQLTQTFNLKGEKVRKRQVLDVNLTINWTGNRPDVNDDIFAILINPKGQTASVPTPQAGMSLIDLTFDDQSELIPCDPAEVVADFCNYMIGENPANAENGFFTGTLDAGFYGPFDATGFNPVFKGTNPKGTWKLKVYDQTPNAAATPQIATLGESTLEVKTGRKFAKED